MSLVSGWFKARLTSAKQDSVMQSGFAGIIESLFLSVVEPLLTRITNRKSFYTMSDEDLDTRIEEMGQFFTIRSSDASSKPMLLQQRLDEIHFKGTSRPITQTFYREFNGVPITWQPLYAPVNTTKYAYGTKLVAENNLDAIADVYGDMFLTSRGVISISYTKLLSIIASGNNSSINTVQEVTEEALTKFKQVSVPLLPLHIVFDGMQMLIGFDVTEPADTITALSVATTAAFDSNQEASDSIKSVAVDAAAIFPDATDSTVEEWTLAKFDNVIMDDWVMDVWSGLEDT